jgi:hypothetical protein
MLIMLAAAVVILDAMSLLDLFKSGKEAGKKLVWTAVVVLLPLVGPLGYYTFARDGASIAGRGNPVP